jgi:uncharacterized protein (DUF2147 family)
MSKANWCRSLGVLGVTAAALLSLGVETAALAAPIAPEGIWYTKDNESIIKVQPCEDAHDGGTFCGTLIWLKVPNETDGSPKLDKLNKDPAKKDKPMIGLVILQNMTADNDHWTGKAYNPDDGKLYDITFKVKTDKTENDQADLRGCILGFLCQTETFNRASMVPGGDPTTVVATATKKHKGAKKDPARK